MEISFLAIDLTITHEGGVWLHYGGTVHVTVIAAWRIA
jgi:hypothetical protein